MSTHVESSMKEEKKNKMLSMCSGQSWQMCKLYTQNAAKVFSPLGHRRLLSDSVNPHTDLSFH